MSTTHEPLLERQRNALQHASQLPQNDPLRILLIAVMFTVRHGGVPYTKAALKKQFWRLYARRYCRLSSPADLRSYRNPCEAELGFLLPADKTPIKYLP